MDPDHSDFNHITTQIESVIIDLFEYIDVKIHRQNHIIKSSKYIHDNMIIIKPGSFDEATIDDETTFEKITDLKLFRDLSKLKSYPSLKTVYFDKNFKIKFRCKTTDDDALIFPNITTVVINFSGNDNIMSYIDINHVFPNISMLVIDLMEFYGKPYEYHVPDFISKIKCDKLIFIFNNKNLNLNRRLFLENLVIISNISTIKTVGLHGLFSLADIAEHPLAGANADQRYHRYNNMPPPPPEPVTYDNTKNEYFVLDNITLSHPIDLYMYNVKLESRDNYHGIKSLYFYNSLHYGEDFKNIDNMHIINSQDNNDIDELRRNLNSSHYRIHNNDDQ